VPDLRPSTQNHKLAATLESLIALFDAVRGGAYGPRTIWFVDRLYDREMLAIRPCAFGRNRSITVRARALDPGRSLRIWDWA
jgi:hypothetical protein